jgi:hypothetical protein
MAVGGRDVASPPSGKPANTLGFERGWILRHGIGNSFRVALVDGTPRERRLVVNLSVLPGPGSEEPAVAGMAGDVLLTALPDRLATLPLVGVDAELRYAALFRSLGEHEFWRGGFVALERDAGRRNPKQH